MESQRKLNEKMIALEKEMQRFQRNCERVQQYQIAVLNISTIWNGWLNNSSFLSERENLYAHAESSSIHP